MNTGKIQISAWLLHPCSILIGMSSGIVIGLFFTETAKQIAPLGAFFLSFLQMCVIPIMSTAIILSLCNLLRSKSTVNCLSRLLVTFICGLILASAVGLLLGLIGKPGAKLDKQAKVALGKVLTASESQSAAEFAPEIEISLNESLEKKNASPSMIRHLYEMIPSNIFNALNDGKNVKILFFSVILGIAISFIPKETGDYFLNNCRAIFQAFEKIIISAMYALPFALCSLLADQVSLVGVEVLYAMIRFVVMLYIGSIFIIILNAVIIRITTGLSFFSTFQKLKDTLFIAVGTRNGFAAMPTALRELHEGLSVKAETANFVMPLGITLCRYGTVMTFALATVFFAQLYETPLGIQSMMIILIGSVIGGISAAGAPGAVALSMLAVEFDPLGLPLAPAIVLLLAVDPVTDPILTLVNVHTNCAAATLIAMPEKKTAADFAANPEIKPVPALIATPEKKTKKSHRRKN